MNHDPEDNYSPLPLLALMVGLALFAAALLPTWAATIEAQPSGFGMVPEPSPAATSLPSAGGVPVTLLAEVALLESSWSAADRAAIWHVIATRAARAGVSWEVMAHRYVSGLHGPVPPASAWKRHVTESCEQPAEWPAAIEGAWPRYVARCRQLMADARAFNRGELSDPCHADHFGSRTLPSDSERAARMVAAHRWEPARCSTVSAFYVERRP